MSYILDALKKSDQERKQGDVPNLQTVHMAIAQEQDKPWVLYGVVLFLLMALAFTIGAILFTNLGEQEQSDLVLQESTINKANESKTISSIIISDISSPARVNKPIDDVKVSQDAEGVVTYAQAAEPISNLSDTKTVRAAVDNKDIPYLSELADYQQQSIPQMSFSGHVYSSDAASRSVIINGLFMSEGDELVHGMRVAEITSSGVVIRFNDIVFRVDVLQNWSFE